MAATHNIISTSLEVVTPETAEQWLAELNVKNRRFKPLAIAQYARDMGAGRWEITGEALKFSASGRLLDGQNRLAACVRAGVPFQTFIIRGISDESQRVMDTGKARTASDALQIGGYKHAAMVAAAAKLALAVEIGAKTRNYAPTHAEIEAFVEENPDIIEAAQFASSVYRRTDCPPSMVCYTTFTLARIDRDAAYDFWTAAADKVGLRAGDPVITLTNRFAEARRTRETIPQNGYLSMIYRAWNTRRAGKTMTFIRLNSPSGGGIIPIPEPR